MQNNIKVPKEFFSKSKKEYNNWKFAFFRELIQNSVDANATKIEFNLSQDESLITIECIDNGSGMNKDIIINKLLALGGSHKNSENAIGGFGYAKTLLFFAHENYTIKTNDILIQGEGGSYDIFEEQPKTKGTYISVKISTEQGNRYLDETEMTVALQDVLNNSNLKTKIYINGNLFKKKKEKFQYTHSTPIGTLYFSENNSENYSSSLYLRINGLAMFNHKIYHRTSTSFNGYIDLNKKPTEVLTSNRDALKGEAADQFNAIFNALQNERSSLKNETFMTAILNKEEYDKSIYYSKEIQNEVEDLINNKFEYQKNKTEYQSSGLINNKASFSPFTKHYETNEILKSDFENIFKSIDQNVYPKNFRIHKSGDNIKNSIISRSLNKSSTVKLAHLWENIVNSVLAANHDLLQHFSIQDYQEGSCDIDSIGYFYDNKKITLGFVFDENTAAVCLKNKNEISIMINPLTIKDLKNKGYYNVRNLIDIAIHEFTHIFCESHNEIFVSYKEEFTMKYNCHYNINDIKKAGKFIFLK